MVENIVAIELSYINTKHPDFQRATDTVSSLMAADRDKDRTASHNSNKPAKNRPVQFANQPLPSPLANGDDKPENQTAVTRVIMILQLLQFFFCLSTWSRKVHYSPLYNQGYSHVFEILDPLVNCEELSDLHYSAKICLFLPQLR